MPDNSLIHDRQPSYFAANKKTQGMLERAKKFANMNGPLLITGPSGSGKSFLAECIHSWSTRASKQCVKRGCGEIDNSTIDSILYGHRRGAFTGAFQDQKGLLELAHGGTLILDDIDYLPLNYQTKLLRFFDDYRFSPLGQASTELQSDVRFIATTNKNLEAYCKSGKFLPDLWNRLSRFEIKTQPLHERPKDIELLAKYYLEKYIKPLNLEKNTLAFSTEAMELLCALDYPGNIRGLEKVVANIASYLDPDEKSISFKTVAKIVFDEDYPLVGNSWNQKDAELHRLLDLTKWNIALTAKIAGICRNTVYKIIKSYDWQNPHR